MRIHSLVVAVMTATPTPGPTSPAPALTAAQAAGFNLALVVLLASVIVVVLALGFALRYHEKLLRVIRMAVKAGQPVATQLAPALQERETTSVRPRSIARPQIVGPRVGTPADTLVFAIKGDAKESTVRWTAEGADPRSGEEACFVTAFAKAGNYVVVATFNSSDDAITNRIEYIVSVGATDAEKKQGASGAAAITLPFVISNWGRLVIVIFGVGVVGALMASAIIQEATGIGILGTLLGVGAAAAMSPTNDVKPGAKEPDTPEKNKSKTNGDE